MVIHVPLLALVPSLSSLSFFQLVSSVVIGPPLHCVSVKVTLNIPFDVHRKTWTAKPLGLSYTLMTVPTFVPCSYDLNDSRRREATESK
ncbi:hypothetical protein J3R30DRAFT_2676573 [Lentinula aciculospora]|uniref:Secreted protein n=1 Tax=Lentinula aciculospora TaxID=153920 RepID=A0A9W8ZSP8_9AGAR|nr:hypothetical protein J3R30DRAFT_2676573 [Lentinula aciculospora]